MKWLNKPSTLFFHVNALVLFLIVLFVIIGVHQLGHFNLQNWKMFKFLWIPTLTYCFIDTIFIVLCLMKKHCVFPLICLHALTDINNALENVIKLFERGLSHAIDTTWGAFSIIADIWAILATIGFILAITGTILWYRNIRYHGQKWWH